MSEFRENNYRYERILISLSFLGLFFFLFPRAVEWLNIYISTLVILYILYILLSKTELKVYWTSFIFIFFLIVLLLKGVPSKEFEYRYFKYLNLVLLFFFYQFNCLFFSKHIKFVSLLFPLVIIVFNFLFILRLFFSADSSIALIENTFDNLGLYCIFLALSVIVFSFFSNRSKIPYIKIVSNCIILLVVISVIIFHSRTALILIIAYLILEHLWTKYSNLKCGIGIIAITSVILLLTFFIKNDSTQGRFFIYKTSISIIKDNPVLGIGYCNFPSVFPVYQAAMFQNGKMSEKEIYLADNTMVALNEYIHTTVEFGVFGLSLLLLTIFLILFYGKAFLSIYLCLCIAMFFSYILHSEVIVYLIILLISLSPAPIISKMSRFISIIICAVIIFITGYNINSVIYKKKCAEIANALWARSPNKLNNFYISNQKYLSNESKLIFALAEFYYHRNDIETALKLLFHLDRIVIRNDIELLKGKCFMKQGNNLLAERHFKLSVAICPNRFLNRFELFKFYLENGMHEAALKTAKEIDLLCEKIKSPHTTIIKKYIKSFLHKKDVFFGEFN